MLYLLIPAHNERDNVPRLLERWRQTAAALNKPLHFCFVDDGSNDDTVAYLRAAGNDVEVIEQQPCQGPGAAFARGFAHLIPKLLDNDYLITLEADNTSDPGIAGKMLAALDQGADLALAACYADGGGLVGTDPLRIFLSLGANYPMRLLLRLPAVTTFTSFYRAYRPALLRRIAGTDGIRFSSPGFVCMLDLLLQAAIAGARLVEVPMVLDAKQRSGVSRMKVLRTIREYVLFVFRRFPLILRRWL